MKQLHISFWLSVIVALAVLCPATVHARTLSDTSSPQTREASSAKVSQLLQQAGYSHRKTGDNTWVINRPEGKGPMLVAVGVDFVVVGVIVAVKDNMKSSADLSFRLLKLNHSADYVKVGFDEDDDLFVRVEERIRIVDLQEFKAMVEKVDSSADTAYETVKPFLRAP
jgi:hypothetical protein